ncbi:MAG: glycoside hydrolase family 15 protein, partial [Synechococcaceae cyanobacterium]
MVSGTTPGNPESAIAMPARRAVPASNAASPSGGPGAGTVSTRLPSSTATATATATVVPGVGFNGLGAAVVAASADADAAPAAVVSESAAAAFLQQLDGWVDQVVLSRQHPVSGLLPASTANTVHGNYADAWVRDCVYSIQCVWGLALAYRRLLGPCRRAYELEQPVLRLMRGLLSAMLKHSAQVE